jgi:hypothetical protein
MSPSGSVPGAYGDYETVFEAGGQEPYITVSDVTLSNRRPSVTLGWHEDPRVVAFPSSASGVAEMRYRGAVIARGTISTFARPARRIVTLPLTRRGTALACRSARGGAPAGHRRRERPAAEPDRTQRHPPRRAPAARRDLREEALTFSERRR